ncbi:hypothetical protein D3C73_1418630 [compost metagenome]
MLAKCLLNAFFFQTILLTGPLIISFKIITVAQMWYKFLQFNVATILYYRIFFIERGKSRFKNGEDKTHPNGIAR